MSIDTSTRRYIRLAISVVILLFCLLAVVLAIIPAIQNIREFDADNRAIRDNIESLQNKLTVLQSIDEETIRNHLSNVLSAVPAERSFPTVFETVEGVAAKTGVTVLAMNLAGGTTLATPSVSQVSVADKKLGTRTIPFSVTVNGSINAVQDFISMIPRVRRLFRIRVFSISFPKDDRSLTVTIDMDAFYEPLPSSIGDVKNTLPRITSEDMRDINRIMELPRIVEDTIMPLPLTEKSKANPFAR